MYLTWPAVCGMLALVNHADGGDNAAKSRRAGGVLCLAAMLAFLLVCRVWCVQTTGWKSADITDTPLVRITTGPAKGIYACLLYTSAMMRALCPRAKIIVHSHIVYPPLTLTWRAAHGVYQLFADYFLGCGVAAGRFRCV